jgi:hypothetical protein
MTSLSTSDSQSVTVARENLFKINYEHIQKLKLLWEYTRLRAINSIYTNTTAATTSTTPTINDKDNVNLKLNVSKHSENEIIFFNDLYCLLVRYQTLSGHGYQAAVSEHVFDIMKQYLHVSVECFASPLNCNLPLYYSLFPDTDAVFGSLGSFFDMFPSEGSFQANPPFIPHVMNKMVIHIHALLGLYASIYRQSLHDRIPNSHLFCHLCRRIDRTYVFRCSGAWMDRRPRFPGASKQ